HVKFVQINPIDCLFHTLSPPSYDRRFVPRKGNNYPVCLNEFIFHIQKQFYVSIRFYHYVDGGSKPERSIPRRDQCSRMVVRRNRRWNRKTQRRVYLSL